MASIYALKPAFQGLLRPLTRALAGAGVTANAVTIAAAVAGLKARFEALRAEGTFPAWE